MTISKPHEFELQGFLCRFGTRSSEWPTHTQAQVIACLAAGMTRKEIAKLRGCSPSSINSTVNALLYYLDARRSAGAVAEAMRRGWIAPLLIALLISSINPDTEAMRHRPPMRTRQQVSASRTVSRRDAGRVFA
ncbi:MAG: helix-turn-helix transcriptional regulator [Halomonas sp.]|nr:helix-turn-helix transcriptional regulator [Halomonas sp.]MCC5904125.1 helix-turn-helix transcriptional regulator [Halomonas sp.]